MEHWKFDHDQGEWCWRRLAAATGEAPSTSGAFRTLRECIADAVENGYVMHGSRRTLH